MPKAAGIIECRKYRKEADGKFAIESCGWKKKVNRDLMGDWHRAKPGMKCPQCGRGTTLRNLEVERRLASMFRELL